MKTKQPTTVSEIVIQQLTLIQTSAIDIMKSYKDTLIPVNLIDKLIESGMVNIMELETDEYVEFFNIYNNMIYSVFNDCRAEATMMGKTHIPLKNFHGKIQDLKDAFIKG